MSGKEARVEALVRVSLDPKNDLAAFPDEVKIWAQPYRAEMLHLSGNGSTASDSARLALQIMGVLNRQEGEYRGVDPVPYRGRINLNAVLRTLRGAIRVETVGRVGDGETENAEQKKRNLPKKKRVPPNPTKFEKKGAKGGFFHKIWWTRASPFSV